MATALHKVRSRKEWAEVISTDWRKSIDSIIQTGRDLQAAKADLAHGEFMRMIDEELPFAKSTAESLMKIAAHPAITNSLSSGNLPSSWSVLAELTKLGAADFKDAEEKGLITSQTNARQARAIAGAYHTPAGGSVGRGASPAMLPSPREASDIARKTSRLVAASDGRLYTGASEEEGDDAVRRRQQTFGIRDAIDLIANSPVSASKWVREAEKFWLHEFKLGTIDAAIKWLTELRPALAAKQRVVDAE